MNVSSERLFKRIIIAILSLLCAVLILLCVILGVQNQRCRERLGGSAADPALADSSAQPLPPEVPVGQALYPELYADDTGRSTVNTDKVVYLTFDDGPSARTPEVLEILERYGVKATFFVAGRGDAQSMEWLRAIAQAGHTLGLHSYSHDYGQVYASVEDYLADCDALNTLIYDAAGTRPQVLRFPGGSINPYNAAIYPELTAEMLRRGFAYFDWNVSGMDTAVGGASAEEIREAALRGLEERRVFLLLHDSAGKQTTVEALPGIIEAYRAAGFSFDRLTVEVTPVVFGYVE